jgi:hypothetical protein
MDEPPEDLPRDVFEEGVLNESKRDESEASDELENGALSKGHRKGSVLAGDTGGALSRGGADPVARRGTGLGGTRGVRLRFARGLLRAITPLRRASGA